MVSRIPSGLQVITCWPGRGLCLLKGKWTMPSLSINDASSPQILLLSLSLPYFWERKSHPGLLFWTGKTQETEIWTQNYWQKTCHCSFDYKFV